MMRTISRTPQRSNQPMARIVHLERVPTSPMSDPAPVLIASVMPSPLS